MLPAALPVDPTYKGAGDAFTVFPVPSFQWT